MGHTSRPSQVSGLIGTWCVPMSKSRLEITLRKSGARSGCEECNDDDDDDDDDALFTAFEMTKMC